MGLKPSEEVAVIGNGLFVLFPTSGTGEWQAATRREILDSHGVLLLNAEAGGWLRGGECAPVTFLYFSLGLEHLWAICATHELGLLNRVMERLKTPRFRSTHDPLARTCVELLRDLPFDRNLEHRSHLLKLGATLLCAEFKQELPPRYGYPPDEEHLIGVLENLAATDFINMPIEELASRFGCSRRHLNRWFKRFFGRSTGALRMELRLLHAAAVLRGPHAKVIDVAERCGFHHLGLFNTCFKRRFGVCPSEWRIKVPDESDFVSVLDGHSDCVLRAKGLCAWGNGKGSSAREANNSRTTGLKTPSSLSGLAARPAPKSSGKGGARKHAEGPTDAIVTPSGITFRIRV